MAAYAALVSLSQFTNQLLSQDQDYAFLCNKEQMLSLHEKVIRLQEFLENISVRSRSTTLDALESRITDVAYQLDYITESVICKLLPQPFKDVNKGEAVAAFSSCIVDINTLLEEATKMKHTPVKKHVSAILHSTSSSSGAAPAAEVINMGLNSACTQMLDTITGQTSNLQIIPITGMGGIGKTTLARAVYNSSRSLHHFDVRLWVTISQEYDLHEVLRGLLSAVKQTEQPDGSLIEQVYKYLKGRRFLIVLDDIWHGKAWDGVMNAFPDDNKGSRIILTTRELGVASYVGSLNNVYKMQLLNEDQSWSMLRDKVFGEEPCPAKLGDIGKTISKNCKGLPLAIVVIAGLLKRNKMKDYWEEVTENINAAATAAEYDQLFGILSLSYNNLPPQLKACFLYVGDFPEDYEFQVKELVMLWIAEGFIKPRETKTVEDIAEECIEELVERSLFLVKKKNKYSGKIKTFNIHDVLREVSMKKAKEEKFLQHNSTSTVQNITDGQNKVSFLTNYQNNSDTCKAHLRSFKYTIPRVSEREVKSDALLNFTRIVNYPVPLSVLCKSTTFRYLCVVHRERERHMHFPKSISKLQNLETFITRTDVGANSTIPLDIWKLKRLRHIVLGVGCKLQLPVGGERGYPILESLQTLTGMWNVNFSMDVIERIPNVNRMKLFYERVFEKKVGNSPRKLYSLSNLQHLQKLEELFISLDYDYQLSDLTFPRNIKKLRLYNITIPLQNLISDIGSLPNLEVLKLRMGSIIPSIWEPVEGEFLQLKYLKMENLHIEEWIVESYHFPRLRTLVIDRCMSLKEVPECIGEIDTLEKLVLFNCPKAKESVKMIRENQQAFDNDLLKITIY